MTLREYATPQKLLAHSILDRVKAGQYVPLERINWALTTLGETIE